MAFRYPNLHTGLVGAWLTSQGPTGSTLHDYSRLGNDGTLTNMVPSEDWVIDEQGWVLNYDRFNDFIDVGTGVSLQVQKHSLVVWVRWTGSTTSDEDTIISRWGAPGVYLLRWDSQNANIEYFTTNVNGGFAGTDLSDKLWHLVVATCDGSTMRVYLDGIESPTTVGSVGTIDTTDTSLAIGGRNGTLIDEWGGNIGDAMVYDRALSHAEIQQLYVIGQGGILKKKKRTLFVTTAAPGIITSENAHNIFQSRILTSKALQGFIK